MKGKGKGKRERERNIAPRSLSEWHWVSIDDGDAEHVFSSCFSEIKRERERERDDIQN